MQDTGAISTADYKQRRNISNGVGNDPVDRYGIDRLCRCFWYWYLCTTERSNYTVLGFFGFDWSWEGEW